MTQVRNHDERAEFYHLGDFSLRGGQTLVDARLSYATFGTLNAARDNCILLPTYYTGTHKSYLPLIGQGRALDPSRWFIVIANMFGNGLSTSPSNWRGAGPYPTVAIGDNVAAQHALLTKHLGVASIALVAGWSMGGMQALHWGFTYPDFVKRVLSWCGGARCWPLNQMFLEGVRAALLADSSETKQAGLRAFGRAYAGWAFSARFYREALWRTLGFATIEAFLQSWEEDHLGWDYRDLLAMLTSWHASDPAALDPQHRLETVLGRITARTLIVPCDQDMYFTAEENAIEAEMIPSAELIMLHSPFGHCAGAPGRFPEETEFIKNIIVDFIES